MLKKHNILLTNRFTAKYTTMEYAMTMRWQTRRTMFVASQPVEKKKQFDYTVQQQRTVLLVVDSRILLLHWYQYNMSLTDYRWHSWIMLNWVQDNLVSTSFEHSPSQTWARHDALKPPIMSKLSLAKAMMSKSSSSPATAPATCTQRFVHLTCNTRHTTAVDDGPRPELNSH